MYNNGKVSNSTTTNYTYGDTNWGDLLTGYDGEGITYDSIGNPLSYYNGKRYTFSWQYGRRLASSIVDGKTNTYTYNMDGIRLTKTVDGVEHTYYYDGGQLIAETWGNSYLRFTYDENGTLLRVYYHNGTTTTMYYYVLNLQGDVLEIRDTANNVVCRYSYDAWGKLLSIKDGNGNAITSAGHIGNINPMRYRGYYYDTETGLYYVSSRYYDAVLCRFVNSDALAVVSATPMALTDKNLYAYCDNNPVVRVDCEGRFWETVFDVISLGASIVEVCVNPTDPWAWASLAGDTVDLVPFVAGVGEVTRAVKTTVKVVDKTTDVVDAAKTVYKTADAASDIRKATGSYEILYKSGKNYIGKGGFKRAIISAEKHAEGIDDILAIKWKSAPSYRDAFIDEYLMQERFGGVLSSNPLLPTHNKIWSPGRKYYGR